MNNRTANIITATNLLQIGTSDWGNFHSSWNSKH